MHHLLALPGHSATLRQAHKALQGPHVQHVAVCKAATLQPSRKQSPATWLVCMLTNSILDRSTVGHGWFIEPAQCMLVPQIEEVCQHHIDAAQSVYYVHSNQRLSSLLQLQCWTCAPAPSLWDLVQTRGRAVQHLAMGIDAELTMNGMQAPVALTTWICQLLPTAIGATPEAWK
jgi:hypothetical protein